MFVHSIENGQKWSKVGRGLSSLNLVKKSSRLGSTSAIVFHDGGFSESGDMSGSVM